MYERVQLSWGVEHASRGSIDTSLSRLIIEDGFKRLDEWEAAGYYGFVLLGVEGWSISWIGLFLGSLAGFKLVYHYIHR